MNRESGTKRTNQPVCMALILLKSIGTKNAANMGKKMSNTNSKGILLSNE